METQTESDGTLLGVDLNITKSGVVVGGDDDVDVFGGTGELLIQLLGFDLRLEQGTIYLVNDDDGFDTFGKSLSEHSLGLDADTLNTVNHDQSTW